MVTLIKEYLSLLQCLLYKAQKRQKIKQILKFQTIFYESQSMVFFILRNKTLKNHEREKIKKKLSEPIFQKLLNICILKKQIQICFFFNSKFASKKQLINYKENFDNFSSFTLFLEYKNKQLFSTNFFSGYLSYLSFYKNFSNWNKSSLRYLKPGFLSTHIQCMNILLFFLPTQNLLLFDINNKKKQLSIKNAKTSFLKFRMNSLSFNYQTFDYFYFHHHNYYLDSAKIQYQNIFYFNLLLNKKQKIYLNNKTKKEHIKTPLFKKNLYSFN